MHPFPKHDKNSLVLRPSWSLKRVYESHTPFAEMPILADDEPLCKSVGPSPMGLAICQ